jgi:hypothetical protein
VVLVLNVAGSPTDGNVTETILDPGPTPTTADPASDTVVIPHTQATVTVPVGETLVVDFGTINSSIGDGWRITQEPDAAVLDELETFSTPDPSASPIAPGSDTKLALQFTAVAPGTTEVTFQYSYRGDDQDTDRFDSPGTVTIEVTVTE